jgi:hypothetical protein
MEKKRLRVMLDVEHEEQLRWLMQKWGLDRNATLGRIVELAAAGAKEKDSAHSSRLS